MQTPHTAKLLLAIALLGASPVFAQSNWTVASGGNWETASNWDNGTVPNSIDADARITNFTTTGARTITAAAPTAFTVGRFDFGATSVGADLDLTLGANISLVFASGSGSSQLNLATGDSGSTMVINSPIELNSALTLTRSRTGSQQPIPILNGTINLQGNTFTVGAMTGSLQLTGLVTGTGGFTLTTSQGSPRNTNFINTANAFSGGVVIGSGNVLQLGVIGTSFSGTAGTGVVGTGPISVSNSSTNGTFAAAIQSTGAFLTSEFHDNTTNLLGNSLSVPSGQVLRIDTSARPINLGDGEGDVSGTGRIVKVGGTVNGMRQLNLNHANPDFSGLLEIQDGQLQTRVTGALAANSTIQFNAQNNANRVGLQGCVVAGGLTVTLGSSLDFVKNGNSNFITTSGTSTLLLNGNFANSGTGIAGLLSLGRGEQNQSAAYAGWSTGVNTGPATIALAGTGTLENPICLLNGTNLATAILSLRNTSGTQTFTGSIVSTGSIIRDGLGGTTLLTAANSYSGSTTLASGTLQVDGAAFAPVTQTATGASATTTLTVTDGTALRYGQAVTGTGIGANAFITAIAGNTVTVSAPNTAAVNGAVTFGGLGATGTGAVVVNGGTLSGSGTLRPTGTNTITVASGAIVHPGAPGITDTLTLDGGGTSGTLATLASGAKLSLDLDGTLAQSDRLTIANGAAGDLVFNGNVIDFAPIGVLADNQTFTLVSASAADNYGGLTLDGANKITGGLSIGTGLSGFSTSHLSVVGSDIVLTLVADAPPNALLTFRAANSLASDGSQDLLTPAGDGVGNLLKYAFNMIGSGAGQAATLATANSSVLAPDGSAGLPLVSVESGTGKLTLTFIRRKASASPAPGIGYAVQFNSDLSAPAGWVVNPSATESVTSLDADLERVVVTDNITASPRRFARVHVSIIP